MKKTNIVDYNDSFTYMEMDSDPYLGMGPCPENGYSRPCPKNGYSSHLGTEICPCFSAV